MKILVISDSHSDIIGCINTIKNINGIDMILHAGDHCFDAKALLEEFKNIDIRYVKGNCDISSDFEELIIPLENKKILLTHGHRYSVKNESDYRTIKNHGIENNCDVVVFGHTHIPYNENFGNIILLNPGSIKHSKTYALIEIEDDKIKTSIERIN